MPLPLNQLDDIYYVAGRHYNHNGVAYAPGDVVPDAKDFRNIEAMVRSRHLIPVVDNHNDVPTYHTKNVKTAELVEAKLGRKIKHPSTDVDEPVDEQDDDVETDESVENDDQVEQPEETEDLTGGQTVPQILETVGDDPELAKLALENELAQEKPRATLVTPLEKVIAKGETSE